MRDITRIQDTLLRRWYSWNIFNLITMGIYNSKGNKSLPVRCACSHISLALVSSTPYPPSQGDCDGRSACCEIIYTSPGFLLLQLTILTLSAVTVALELSILNVTSLIKKVQTSSQKRYVSKCPCSWSIPDLLNTWLPAKISNHTS